jgi:hypothetical protein
MTSILTYLSAFGLASGAGAKAFIPILMLGGLHYTDYFQLSDRFLWIADPAVMTVLAILMVLEVVVDAHPDLGQFADEVAYLPKFVAGFIGFAAVVGTIDQDLVSLTGSGLLGGGTAVGVHWLRNQIRKPFRLAAEDVHESFGKAATLTEAGTSVAVAGSAMVVPPVSLLLMGGIAAAALVASGRINGRRVSCIHCGEPIRTNAVVCFHCGGDQ